MLPPRLIVHPSVDPEDGLLGFWKLGLVTLLTPQSVGAGMTLVVVEVAVLVS
jgi:hypothetical protein